MIMGLDQLAPGRSGRVVRVTAAEAVRRRLAEMGVIRGTHVRVERVAPFGDPMEIRVRGYRLSLRMDEARMVTVEAR
ncbi:MAG: ferrous iron transport protein A [Candidatus Krumholzibacteria bacterium]|nr:ferrous iron transport protein A [Candidatus Krumholzibacteria bacterium]